MTEHIQKGSETHYLSYISSPEGLVAMHISDDNGRDEMKYVLTDYLGTIYALVDDGAQSTMNKSIDWGDALWGDIDFLDCAISGISDVATLGVSKITKLLKISKTGMKAINIGFKAINTYVSNSFKSQHDFTPNDGYKVYHDDINDAGRKASNLKSFTLDIAFDFAFEKIVPKKYVGSFDSKRFIDRLKRFAASTFTMPAGNEFQNRIFEHEMNKSNEYIFDDENGEWIRDNTPKIPYMINFNNGGR